MATLRARQRLSLQAVLRSKAHQELAKAHVSAGPDTAAVGAVRGERRTHEVKFAQGRRPLVEIHDTEYYAHEAGLS
jgi:hypothetical protein